MVIKRPCRGAMRVASPVVSMNGHAGTQVILEYSLMEAQDSHTNWLSLFMSSACTVHLCHLAWRGHGHKGHVWKVRPISSYRNILHSDMTQLVNSVGARESTSHMNLCWVIIHAIFE